MTQRVLCQHARVLHARSFRETSLLVDFFTQEHGRVCAVARGARTQRSKFRGLLQPFIPVTISWSGRSDLVTLSDAEPCGMPLSFSGTALLSGLYINELLVRLLARHDPHPELFMYYEQVLLELYGADDINALLRVFEKTLLTQCGYGFDWHTTADTGESICAEQWYVFVPEQGFLLATQVKGNYLAFQGSHLLAIADNQFHDKLIQRSAKQIMRAALTPLLQGKPIRSRELFV